MKAVDHHKRPDTLVRMNIFLIMVESIQLTTLIISKKPVTTGKSRDKATEFTTKLLLLE